MSRTATILFPNGKSKTQNIPTVESWDKIVQLIRPSLKPGLILALSGPLGAGKTTFVQHLAIALGAKKSAQSPTFALMRIIPVKDTVHRISRLIHIDAYRIENEADLRVLDIDEELADKKSICVLEWPENVPSFLTQHAENVVQIQICL